MAFKNYIIEDLLLCVYSELQNIKSTKHIYTPNTLPNTALA